MFYFHVIDALYYSVVNVRPAVSRLPGRGVQLPGPLYPRVEVFGFRLLAIRHACFGKVACGPESTRTTDLPLIRGML